MLEMVIERLKDFGYEATDADKASLVFVIAKVEQSVLNECNLLEIPEELKYIVVNMACGEFLQTKFSLGQLDLGELDLDGALKSVTEGDVSVTLDNSFDDTKKLQSLIGGLLATGKDELICFRKLRW